MTPQEEEQQLTWMWVQRMQRLHRLTRLNRLTRLERLTGLHRLAWELDLDALVTLRRTVTTRVDYREVGPPWDLTRNELSSVDIKM